MYTKPPRLRPGDTIGIVSPSWGGAAIFPHRVERGVAQIEGLGFQARLAPNARHQTASESWPVSSHAFRVGAEDSPRASFASISRCRRVFISRQSNFFFIVK